MTEPTRPDLDPTAQTTSYTAPGAAGVPETAAPIATSPVVPPAGSAAAAAPRSGRTRWLAALGIIGVVAAASIAAAVVLTGSSPAATVMGYVPTDSVMYGEVRLDLPGDQEREIGEFLSKFPGFADQAALDTKLDEVLDRLISEASEGEQTFTKDVKPWFDGEMAFALGPLPSGTSLQDPEAAMGEGRGLVLLSIKDEALARAWFDKVLADMDVTGATETYAGTELTVYREPDTEAQGAFALVGGKVAIAGDLTSVKASIDTKGSGGLAGDEAFKAASVAMDGDHVGFFFMDAKALITSAMSFTEGLASAPPISEAMLALVPDWMAGRMRIEGDALVMDAAYPHIDGAPGPDGNRKNGVADWAPAGTILLAAGNDYGSTLLETVALYRQDPNLAEVFEGIDGAAGVLGGLDAALGWMGDAGIVLARDGDVAEGGLVAIPADAAKARQFLTTIRSFAQLGGGGAGITIRDEDYAGATITIIDLGSAEDLVGMAGALGGGVVPTDPGTTGGLPDGNVEIAYVATDDVVVIGSGPDFVRSVLDAGAGSSLADDARFSGLVSRVGAEHTGITFVDVAAVRGLVEDLMASAPAADVAEYEESVKPFLAPFDAFVAAGSIGGELDTQHAIITVK